MSGLVKVILAAIILLGGVGWTNVEADAAAPTSAKASCSLAKTKSTAQAEVARTCVYAAFKARQVATGASRTTVPADSCSFAGPDRARCTFSIAMSGGSCRGAVLLTHLSPDPARIRARGLGTSCVA